MGYKLTATRINELYAEHGFTYGLEVADEAQKKLWEYIKENSMNNFMFNQEIFEQLDKELS